MCPETADDCGFTQQVVWFRARISESGESLSGWEAARAVCPWPLSVVGWRRGVYRRGSCPSGPSARFGLDESFVLESAHGLADRSAADAKGDVISASRRQVPGSGLSWAMRSSPWT
jgi:hypothetical protein